MQDLKKIIEIAEELKLATLRAKEIGIASYSKYYNSFHIVKKDIFLKIAEGNTPTVKFLTNTDYPYRYEVTIDGVTFTCITKEPLFLEAEKDTTCMGCYHFEPKGGNLGYCEIQDHIISIEMGCEEWEPADV